MGTDEEIIKLKLGTTMNTLNFSIKSQDNSI